MNSSDLVIEDDFSGYEVTSSKILLAGDGVLFSNRKFIVSKAVSQMIGAQLISTYTLTPSNGIGKALIENVKIKGASLEGKVTQVKDTSVQVQLSIVSPLSKGIYISPTDIEFKGVDSIFEGTAKRSFPFESEPRPQLRPKKAIVSVKRKVNKERVKKGLGKFLKGLAIAVAAVAFTVVVIGAVVGGAKVFDCGTALAWEKVLEIYKVAPQDLTKLPIIVLEMRCLVEMKPLLIDIWVMGST